MNTIVGARFNDSHDPLVTELIDTCGEWMKTHSPGCALIDGLMADCWDGFDPWGSTLDAAFALEYACQYLGLPTHPEFSSPYTMGDPDEGLLYTEFRDAFEDGRLTADDIVHARKVLDRLLDGLRLAGLDY